MLVSITLFNINEEEKIYVFIVGRDGNRQTN